MRKAFIVGVVAVVGLAAYSFAQEAKSSHVIETAAELKWGAAPPVFQKGAMLAVISGDPGKSGPFVVRLKMPAGYKIAAHWHPTDEHVTVVSGTFALGMGDKFNLAALKTLPPGGYGLMPAEMRHFAIPQGR